VPQLLGLWPVRPCSNSQSQPECKGKCRGKARQGKAIDNDALYVGIDIHQYVKPQRLSSCVIWASYSAYWSRWWGYAFSAALREPFAHADSSTWANLYFSSGATTRDAFR
jgi:hypothetical protein